MDDEWDGDLCIPDNTFCDTVWWHRLARALREDPRGWFTHACIFSGSLPVLLCCILYAAEYMGPISTTLVCLCDALQCVAYYVWHWRVLRHNCFTSSVSWLSKGMALSLYTVAIAFKLATPWCVVYAPDRTSAMGVAGGAYIYHWTMYTETQLTLWCEARCKQVNKSIY